MISTQPHSKRGMPPKKPPKAAVHLPENEVSFRELFECAPVAYHETDAAGVLRRVNGTECRLLGFTSEEMIGRPVWDFVAAEQREACGRNIRGRMAVSERLTPSEYDFVRKDGG